MTSPTPHVTVHAIAYQAVTPDRFETTVRVICRDDEALAATAALTRGFARVEAAIDALPVELDVTVDRGGVSLRKVGWGSDKRTPEWIASRSATLISPDIEHAGDVIGPFAALADEVDGLELEGPRWRLDRDNPAHAQLQADAVHEARARAERYAAALGGRLGALVELADPEFRGATRAVALSGYSPGEGFEIMDFAPVAVEVEASVQGQWALILP